MARKRGLQWLLWVLLIASPVLCIALIGLATGTNPLAVDAWNTTWNDEQSYYWTVQQMRLYGQPVGVAGYNEVAAARASYGPYSPFVFAPYYIGSLVTGLQTHSFMYLVNVGLGVLAAIAIVVVVRPDVRTALALAVFFGLQFIIGRYVASGMTEASYVLFGALFASCAAWLARSADAARNERAGRPAHRGRHARSVPARSAAQSKALPARSAVAFVVLILCVGFWGMMRPYLLVFVLVPCVLLVAGDYGLPKAGRIVLFVLAVLVAFATLAGYLYFSKYYAVPYFYSASIANSLVDRLAAAAAGFVGAQVDAVTYTGASLLKLKWAGIMTFAFALAWFVLLGLALRARKRGQRCAFALMIALLLAGAALFEANILLYTAKQMHRTLIAVDVMYVLAIAVFGARASSSGVVTPRSVYVVVVAALCVGALALHPQEFPLPQADASADAAQEAALCDELSQLMPQVSDPWDNTIAHPVESSDMKLYFYTPRYLALNCCQQGYLESAIKTGTLKSKYVSLPDSAKLNKAAKKRYRVVYEGMGHIVYAVR